MNGFKTVFFAWIFPWVPKRMLSRLTGVVMRIPIPGFLAGPLITAFANFFNIKIEEAERAPGTYHSFDDFFTRKLKPGLRPFLGDVIHPADAVVTEQGVIKDGQMVQVKDWTYSLSEFLGNDELAKAYEGGTYYTYYLCPADYHRVHAAAAGNLVGARHIPGLLWPVNQWSVHNIRRLFNLNERAVFNFTSARGRWSLIMVGATNVGYIGVTLDPSIVTNRWLWHAPTDRLYMPPLAVERGDELGVFHLGSTVMCVYEKSFGLAPGVRKPVLLGQQV